MEKVKQELQEKEITSRDAQKIMDKLLDLEKKILALEEKVENQQVRDKDEENKILKNYSEKKKNLLITKAWKNGKQGLDKHDLAGLFEVKEEQGRRIIGKVARQYSFFEKRKGRGSKPNKLVHKVSAKADKIAEEVDLEDSDTPKTEVLDRVGWNGDKKQRSLEVLPDLKANLEKIREEREKADGNFNPDF